MQKITKLAVLFALLGASLAVSQGSIKDRLGNLAQIDQSMDDSSWDEGFGNCTLGTLPALSLMPCNVTAAVSTPSGAA